MNVDRAKRDKLAEMLRHFAAGRLTNTAWMSDSPMGEDRALYSMWISMWGLYDDVREHTLTGRHALPPEMQHHVARFILFLYSDLAYEWPERLLIVEIGARVLYLITLGRIDRVHPRFPDYWPFRSQSDFDAEAAKRPRLLAGAK